MGGVPEKVIEEKLIDEGIVVVHYDLPIPRKGSDNNNTNNSNDRNKEVSLLLTKWRSWYDWATRSLRSIGYPIGYSVVLTDVNSIKNVYVLSEKIRERYVKLKNQDRWGILPSENSIRIGVVKFKPATRDDLKGLEAMFRSYLKESLETIKDYIVKKLKEEKKDPKDVSMRVRRMVKRLKKQDCFNLLERDEELKKLIEVLDILTV